MQKMNSKSYDVAVVGAGIVGLAHAYYLAKRGLKVGVFERGAMATGASVRNFGMVWPIGQPPGEMRQMALNSRQTWLEVLQQSGIWHRPYGSMHLAHHEDELVVLEEFASKAPDCGYECAIITAQQAKEKSPEIRTEGLLGAMWSPDEISVFPRQVVPELSKFLESMGVEFHFSCAVSAVESGRILAGGQEFLATNTFICTGDDFETLFPARFKEFGMIRTKLQMLRARPRRNRYDLGCHLCAGLTLGHYANFRICESLAPMWARVQRELPEYVKWGIHLLVSQHEDGQVTIGDSHEYGDAVFPFLREDIDRFILAYLDTFLPTNALEITERWFGVYAKHPTKPYVIDQPIPGATIATGVGGAGMTLSFGFAEKVVSEVVR